MRLHAGLLLVPAILFYAVLFVWPLIISTWGSFTPTGKLSLQTYTLFFADEFYRSVLWRSLRISAITTLMTLIIGYPIAVYLSQSWRKGRSLVVFLVIAPMFVSAVVRSYGWIIILGPNGLLSSFTKAIGLPMGHLLYSEAGVIIALTHVFLPFMVIALAGSLQQIDPSLARAAQILGANGFSVFVRVILPLTLPGISAGSVIVFCLAASGFVTPALVGGAAVPVMPYLVYKEGLLVLNWPFASAVALILLAATALATAIYTFAIRDAASKRSVVR
ncbi:Spermidine/putrescine transport system permease protein PotB [Afipia felis]|jgi:putative spermidine/putrescine transport system permease protein|uniref:Spermidine/putrescine transport system permease protein PotB n=2 Tax=Afipia TaxID=1033 RepID=A0A090N7R0_AFIFE|nr:ABC transporter permease [Afipia felis]EFI50565.1 binding-protein-dependent transport systems inner membrane component [Afipia sp. 1NLS2]CEG09038.1 Spermidine/putrescine transport system permease protein PotB [Afipia felis]